MTKFRAVVVFEADEMYMEDGENLLELIRAHLDDHLNEECVVLNMDHVVSVEVTS